MPRCSQERLARKRACYAERRLRELRYICPDLRSDILDRANLRSVSFAVRRASRKGTGPYQASLSASRASEASEQANKPDLRTPPGGARTLMDAKHTIAEEVCSNEYRSGQA